jgi:hypothetical protein
LELLCRFEQCPKCAEKGKDTRGDNLAIYADGSSYCFSCRYHSGKSIKSKLFPEEDKEAKAKQILPPDIVNHIPIMCVKWLLQFGIPYEYWKGRIGWSAQTDRLVFRVGDPVQFSVGRNFSKDAEIRKWYCWGDSHKEAFPIGEGSITVLVEDIISAHKVGQITETIPLFGTNIFPDVIKTLQRQRKPVLLWLDKDQEGNTVKQAVGLQTMIGCPVSIIHTEKDPKNVSFDEISSYIVNRRW